MKNSKGVNDNNKSHVKIWLRKGSLKRDTESLLIAAQNNAIWTDNVKTKIDKTRQNNRCKLCGDRDETINCITSEWSKLVQKEYKTRYDWVGKMIHWELCQKFNFDNTNKYCMHNPDSILENETHKLLWYFEIQTDHLILTRWRDLVTVNNKRREPAK